jgi:acyl-CoA synthetase (AMP-forming)/AMP-acid ligase II
MFIDYLDRGVRHNPDGVCTVRADGSGALTHREFSALTHRVALGLQAQGLGPGSKVAVLGANSSTAFACVVGIIRAGAGWVALNPRAETAELVVLLELLDCEYLICSEEDRERAGELLRQAPGLRGSVAYAEGDDLGADFASWLGPEGGEIERLAVDPQAPVMYTGTGGTTGTPKGLAITNRQFLTMCLAFEAHLHEPEPSVYLMATPMTHAAGCFAFPTVAAGGTIVVPDGVEPVEVFDSIERHGISRLFLPPTAVYALLAHPDARRHDYSSLRHFVYAAAPMSVDKLVEAMEVFGPVMTQVFGQAEAPGVCTCFGPREHAEALADPAKRKRLSSCGRATVVASVEIMDDDGCLLGAGERGEIVARGDLVMQGYYNNPEASDAVRRPGGWHGTGDIGYRDEDGYFYIVDRKRDMIISGGFNVFPSEVERVIWSHEAVLDCAVIGVPDEKWGEAVTAIVELKDGLHVEAQELISRCKQTLGSVQAPKAVHFRELPRSPNGKVLKRVLRDEFWAGRERQV